MQIRRVCHDEAEIRRFVSECWIPYHEELSAIKEGHALVDDAEDESVEFLLDALDSPGDRLWVALDDPEDPRASLSTVDATFAGFVRTSVRQPPDRFDWSRKLELSDCWVRESYRGSGLVDDLVARAAQQGREDGCTDLTLSVGVENERAVGYAEQLGFEVQGFGMNVPLEAVNVDVGDGAPTADADSTLRRVPAEEAVLRRFVEECWIPFWEDEGEAVGEQHLSPELDREELVEKRLESYEKPDRRCWVALDDADDPTRALDAVDATFAGHIDTKLLSPDPFLDPPEQLLIGYLYAAPAYRGTGLTDRLVARAMQFAREEGCVELVLGVEAGNDRAMGYYEKIGFELLDKQMSVPLDEVDLSATTD